MKKSRFIYDDIFLLHEMPAGHPESKDRLITINETLQQSGIWSKLLHMKPRKADLQDILAVHSGPYVEKIMNFTGYYDPDTYISKTLWRLHSLPQGCNRGLRRMQYRQH